jgi:S-adenosylmethionine decarboxylase
MIFEGNEKKLELVVSDKISLLEWPEERFHSIVRAADTQILSKIENSDSRAYLLSESSLFVWNNRMTMITCGQSTLVNAALKAFEYLQPEQVEALFYERKNEYYPQQQKTDFFSDIRLLNAKIKGRAFRLGTVDEHHLYLFHSNLAYKPKRDDTTLEILMYGLQGPAHEIFNQPGLDTAKIREATKVDQLLPGFLVDDYAFSPVGYSLNAIKGDRYYTVHVTPQEQSSYVSFETNLTSHKEIATTVSNVIETFQPRSFDLVYFDGKKEAAAPTARGYTLRSEVLEKLTCGFRVHYSHHSLPGGSRSRAFELKI